MMNYTDEHAKAINDYLAECIKNNYHCQHCAKNYDGICFFAFLCFANDMMYFDDGDDDCSCSVCFEDSCENCAEGDLFYDC